MEKRDGWKRREILAAGAAGSAASLIPRLASAKGKWEVLAREGGITVTARVQKNRQYPTFRGTARMNCSPWDIIAVVADADRHKEWAHKCSESAKLKEIDPTTSIVYSRTGLPWPVKDRDVIIRGKVSVIQPDTELRIRFSAISSSLRAVPPDVVRIPVLEGHWYLVGMGENKTFAEYQVNADPGGALPEWLVEQSSRDMPLITIRNMRKQIKKTKDTGMYDDWIAQARAFKQGSK
jgi:hypothetical protein